MNKLSFFEKLSRRREAGKYVCFGFDPVYDRIPKASLMYDQDTAISKQPEEMLNFCKKLIEPATEVVGCFKPNIAFFERYGSRGISALEDLIAEMRKRAPEIPIILDAKRADIGKTNEGYAEFAFDHLKVDAITVQPYFGHEAMEPFWRHADKGVIVLCKTSNPGSGEFQNLPVYNDKRKPLYQQVAENVANHKMWNLYGNCALMVGATFPEELMAVRGIVGNMEILIPGVGTQGGSAEMAVRAGMNSRRSGFIINTSSGAMFASSGPDFVEATVNNLTKINDEITNTLSDYLR